MDRVDKGHAEFRRVVSSCRRPRAETKLTQFLRQVLAKATDAAMRVGLVAVALRGETLSF
jgi:hypothetical protein